MALEAREKRLLLIPAGLAAVLAFYQWVHAPLFARRAEAAEKVQKVSADLARDQNRLAKEGNLRSRKEAVAAREMVIDAAVPGRNSAVLFIWYLSQAEQRSGARITGLTVGERKQVSAASHDEKQGAQPNPQGAGQDGSQPAQGSQEAPDGAAPGNAPTLTVIRIDMKVDARFAEHLLLHQEFERMPLFLRVDSIAIAREGTKPAVDVEKLVEKGKAALALQVLDANPTLSGEYHIDVFYKDEKAGPATDPMQFETEAGRMDPYVPQANGEVIQIMQDHMNGAGGKGSGAGGAPYIPDPSGAHREQMG